MSKKIIVTGGEGFIGVWVTQVLLRRGWRVISLDNRSSKGRRMFDEVSLNESLEGLYDFNVCDDEELQSIILHHKPVAIINLAGQAIVPRAFVEPLETFKTNCLGTLSVLEAARVNKCIKSVVTITSDKVYENYEQFWPYRESDELGGKDIYSVSKSSAELVARAYSRTHLVGNDVNVQTVRLGNVVGGGDWSINRLLPDLMNSIDLGREFKVRYPLATRPFQHVLDVAFGILNILEASLVDKISSGECWNLGPKNNSYCTVKDVIELCQEKWSSITIIDDIERVKEDMHLSVEVTKYTRFFGAPKWTSIEAIKYAITWYEKYFQSSRQRSEIIDLNKSDLNFYVNC
jgi:CDP-glucose 4,6-dehydratase